MIRPSSLRSSPSSSLALTLLVGLAFFEGACGSGARCRGARCVNDAGIDEIDASGAADAGIDTGIDAGPVVVHCADLFANGVCPAHRICEESTGLPICQPMCDVGFAIDSGSGACVDCTASTCAPTPSCTLSVPGSIASACAMMHRGCVQVGSEPAVCGACDAHFVVDPASMECVGECAALTCPPDAPAELQGGVCVCQARPCGPSAAQSLGAGAACVACGPSEIVCDPLAGELTIYPFLDTSDRCVCKTGPGFYWSSDRMARPCDEDGDGWITRSAYQQMQSTDPTIQTIATQGCSLKLVDRIVLQNEYGQTKTLFLCTSGTLETDCPIDNPSVAIPLVEPDVNDSDGTTPSYRDLDGTGRPLRARELNAVTKGCASATGDFDGNLVFDVSQSQPTVVDADPVKRWAEFAYFTELHVGSFVPPEVGHDAGRFVIAERSRCSAGAVDGVGAPLDDRFPLGYSEGTSTYWTSCARQRDVAFDPLVPASGFDFARRGYACDMTSCDVPPAPRVSSFSGDGGAPEPHGLCDALAPFPDNGSPWMGMEHYSQFKCVHVGVDHLPSAFASLANPDGDFDFQTCTPTSDVDDTHLDVTCATRVPVSGDVGWAAVRYTTTTKHALGCTDETRLANVCDVSPLTPPQDPTLLLGLVQPSSEFGRILACPRYCGRYAQREVCSAAPFDEDCDGTIDNVVVPDSSPTSLACNDVPTYTVGLNQTATVSGTVDATGDDFFRVSFSNLGGLGSDDHTRIRFVTPTDGRLVMEAACSVANGCAAATTIEARFNQYATGCGEGTCGDGVARRSVHVIRVHRANGATTFCSNGAPYTYSILVERL